MSSRPRTIQIYLPSGDPRGLRVAELTTHIVRVIEVPRARLEEFREMPEAKQVGFYFLVGDSLTSDKPSVYIGEAAALGKRFMDHHRDKEFWNRALAVVSLTNSLTQTHTLCLEWKGIKHANDAARYYVENGNSGINPYTPAPLAADCEEIFDTVRTLLATLGHPVFEPLAKPKAEASVDELYYCRTANYDASGEYTAEGFVVLKGSKARVEMTPSMAKTSFGKRRQAYLDDGTLKLESGYYVFQRDVLFKTPSGASDMVTGASTNGWDLWKTKGGKTLHELERAPLVGTRS